MKLKAKTLAEAVTEILEMTPSPKKGEPPMTRAELGEIIGITPSNVSRIANPNFNQRPSDEVLRALAERFSDLVSYEELVQLREQSPPPKSSQRAAKKSKSAEKKEAPKADKKEKTTKAKKEASKPRGRPRASAGKKAKAKTAEKATAMDPEQRPMKKPAERAVKTPKATAPAAAPTEQSRPEGASSGFFGMPSSTPAVPDHRPGRREGRGVTMPGSARPRSSRPEEGAVAVAEPAAPPAPMPQAPEAPQAQAPEPVIAQQARTLVSAHIPTISLYAQTLQDETPTRMSASIRFTVAATLALGELDRVSGESRASAATQAAATALLNDLWRISEKSSRPLPTEDAERDRLEQFLAHSPDRSEAYRRLTEELKQILFAGNPNPGSMDDLKIVLLRTLALGARA